MSGRWFINFPSLYVPSTSWYSCSYVYHSGSLVSMIDSKEEPQTPTQLILFISWLTVDECPLDAYSAYSATCSQFSSPEWWFIRWTGSVATLTWIPISEFSQNSDDFSGITEEKPSDSPTSHSEKQKRQMNKQIDCSCFWLFALMTY